jgi:hypothetical protein
MALFPAREYPLLADSATRLNWRRIAITLLLLAALGYTAASVVRIVVRKYYVFLPGYVSWMATPSPDVKGPTHLLVMFADHFEPNRQVSTTDEWMRRYTAMASRHRDVSGRPPQHTWFYPAEQWEEPIMRILLDGVRRGFGEVEFHFHHDYDTVESLRPRLESALDQFATLGFNRTVDGQTRFAFVHGNFGLDNSNGPYYCGVPNEIALLRELGAFADFSFPSIYLDSQPPFVNDIVAVRDDDRPKSYAAPLPLSLLRRGEADMMMFEGPLIFAPTWNMRRLFLELDDGDVHPSMPASPKRIPRWVRANVHVPQRPEWVFIKLFAHGAESPEDIEAVTGDDFDETLSYLEQHYNDGENYVLHYVTAREAYNIAMAAVDGQSGNPESYRDYIVRPYLASRRP